MDNPATGVRRFGRNWGWMLAYGVLLVIVGVIAIWNPLATGLAVGLLLSISFFVAGAGSIFAAFSDAGWQAKTVDVLYGVLALVAGFLCLLNPFGGALSVVLVIGVILLIAGAFEIVSGFRAAHDKVWLILLGVADLLIGGYTVFFMGPGAALLALATIVGLSFLFRGVLLSVLAFNVRGLSKR